MPPMLGVRRVHTCHRIVNSEFGHRRGERRERRRSRGTRGYKKVRAKKTRKIKNKNVKIEIIEGEKTFNQTKLTPKEKYVIQTKNKQNITVEGEKI